MARLPSILADEGSAAQLLDMTVAKFLDLVGRGHLPEGKELAPVVLRWDVDQLRQIGKGDAIDKANKW